MKRMRSAARTAGNGAGYTLVSHLAMGEWCDAVNSLARISRS